MRRSEVAALRWADISAATDAKGLLVSVRTSKTNQEGAAADIRYLKNGAAEALRKLRAHRSPQDSDLVFGGLTPQTIGNRFGTIKSPTWRSFFLALGFFFNLLVTGYKAPARAEAPGAAIAGESALRRHSASAQAHPGQRLVVKTCYDEP